MNCKIYVTSYHYDISFKFKVAATIQFQLNGCNENILLYSTTFDSESKLYTKSIQLSSSKEQDSCDNDPIRLFDQTLKSEVLQQNKAMISTIIDSVVKNVIGADASQKKCYNPECTLSNCLGFHDFHSNHRCSNTIHPNGSDIENEESIDQIIDYN